MRLSGITISKGELDYVLHNVRAKPTNNSIFDHKNIYMNSYEEAIELYKKELKKRVKAYTDRTGKKLQKKTITHLTAIVNLDEHNANEEYMQKLVSFLEDRYDTKVFNWAIHLDEGWIDENKEEHINYHAHIEMMGIDSNGWSIRRKLNRVELINLQTEVAKILDMQRGQQGSKKKRLPTYTYKKVVKEHYEQLQRQKKEHQEQIEYERKLRREAEERAKRLEEENKELKEELARVKDLKEENKRIRDILKQLQAKREHYAKLEAFIKELKEQIKAKELSVNELRDKLKAKENELVKEIEERKRLEEENKQLKEKVGSLAKTIQELEEKLKQRGNMEERQKRRKDYNSLKKELDKILNEMALAKTKERIKETQVEEDITDEEILEYYDLMVKEVKEEILEQMLDDLDDRFIKPQRKRNTFKGPRM